MRINEAKYNLAMARACKETKDLVAQGVSRTTLAQSAKKDLKPSTVGRIARALGCDVTDIID